MKIDIVKISAVLIIVLALLMYSGTATETTWRHSGFELWGYDINCTDHNLTNLLMLDFNGSSSPGVSSSDSGTLYYDLSTQKIRISEDGGSYIDGFGYNGSIQVIIDGGGSAITSGNKSDVVVPYSGTIEDVILLADQTGNATVAIYQNTSANHIAGNPPRISDSIGSFSISSGIGSKNSTISQAISKDDELRIRVTSADTIERLSIILNLVKTTA